MSPRFPLAIWIAGLLLRAPGLFLNGNPDLIEIMFSWGTRVLSLGLAQGFDINYGILSYAAFGAAAALAEEMPRYWFLPVKAFTLAFEAAAVWALLRLARPPMRVWVLAVVWLNPWFILHGAYLGFWEAPHILCALLAVLVLAQAQDRRAWLAVGVLLFCSSQFKPQGLLHFAAPLGLYLAVHAMRGRPRPLLWYCAGFGAAAAIASLLLWAGGASPLVLIDNVRSAMLSRPWLSNGGLGIWRFVTFVAMEWQGMEGPITLWKVSIPWLLTVSALSSLVLLALFVRFLSGLADDRQPSAWSVYLVLVFGALVLSQFGLRSHINHTYPALLLLIPLLPGRRTMQVAWGVTMALMLLAHAAAYGIGDAGMLPSDDVLAKYQYADRLADLVRPLSAVTEPDAVLRMQAVVTAWLARLATDRWLSVLSLLVFAAACVLTAGLFTMARTGRADQNFQTKFMTGNTKNSSMPSGDTSPRSADRDSPRNRTPPDTNPPPFQM